MECCSSARGSGGHPRSTWWWSSTPRAGRCRRCGVRGSLAILASFAVLREAGSQAALGPRGSGITVGRFLDCWDPENGLTHQACCDAGALCFDEFYTRGRCCHQDGPDGPAAPVRGCLQALRASLLECIDQGCDAMGREVCNELIETPSCAAHCGGLLPQGNGSSVTRSSRLGRALWCLAQRPEVGSVLDLFLAEGDGSANLLLDGLGRAPVSQGGALRGASVLISFERAAESFEAASRWLRERTPADVVELRLSGQEEVADLQALALEAAAAVKQKGDAASAGAHLAVILHGEPYPDGGLLPSRRLRTSERPSPLRALCEVLPVDLVFLDPDHGAADAEFWAIEKYCQPLRWVVVNNANLPGFSGWVREHLLSRPGWAEILAGRTSDPWGAGSGSWLAELYKLRVWSVLGRTSEVCPPS